MERTLAALAPYVARGVPVIGLEPSCLFTFRDEMPALLKSDAVDALSGRRCCWRNSSPASRTKAA